jgi:peroxiredoxin
MRNLKLHKFAIAIALAVLSISAAHAQHDVHASLIAKVDRKPVPVFHLVSDTGKTIQVSNFRGKVVLINFWATTCGGCVLEIPSFIDLQKTYANKGFTAIGISADIPYEGLKNDSEAWARVHPFIASHHLNYPILMGNGKVIDSFGFKSYPATFLVDKTGRIAATYVGVVSKEDVAANIDRLLKE